MANEQQKRIANKARLVDLMRDPEYNLCLFFYPENSGVAGNFGYTEKNLLPQLWWEITELRVHPCGLTAGGHWRLSLQTADHQRTFFNCSNKYIMGNYGQFRIGPGRDDNGPLPTGARSEIDYSFAIPLSPNGPWTLEHFVDALLHPTADDTDKDGVKDGKPMCWYQYKEVARECRYWVQSAAKVFQRKGFLDIDASALSTLFRQKNDLYGYKNEEIPKGPFFDSKPPGMKPAPSCKPGEGGEAEKKKLAAEPPLPGWI